MPKLSKHERPTVKIDSSGAVLDIALPKEHARGLWEKPGATVVGIVTLASTSYVGHALAEEKQPVVKLRIVAFEAARPPVAPPPPRCPARALYRHRTWDGTFEEAGMEPIQDPATVLQVAFAQYPSEEEFQGHQEAQRVLRRQQREAEESARAEREHSLL